MKNLFAISIVLRIAAAQTLCQMQDWGVGRSAKEMVAVGGCGTFMRRK